MNDPVHILVTVRKPELLPAALLVFRTLRVGCPANPVQVWGNQLAPQYAETVRLAVDAVGGAFTNLTATFHDAWIEALLARQTQPFWICDSDVVFFAALPPAEQGAALQGRWQPTFLEELTDTVHVEQLHPSLMWFNPAVLRPQLRAWLGQFPNPWGGTAQCPMIRQHFIPRTGQRPLFYDTTAGLWQAGIGTPFTPEQDAAFEHLHCGATVDLFGHCPGLKDLAAVHAAVLENPQVARGLHAAQRAYHERRKV